MTEKTTPKDPAFEVGQAVNAPYWCENIFLITEVNYNSKDECWDYSGVHVYKNTFPEGGLKPLTIEQDKWRKGLFQVVMKNVKEDGFR